MRQPGLFAQHVLRQNLSKIGIRFTNITAVVPVLTNCSAVGCGYDSLTGSAINPICATCNGTGKTKHLDYAYFKARINWNNHADFKLFNGQTSGEIADVLLQISALDLGLLEKVKRSDMAYLLFDGKKIRPSAITINRVHGMTSYIVDCNIVQEDTL